MAGFPHDSTLQQGQFMVLEGIFHFQKIRIFCHENTHILSCTCLNYKLKILKKRCQEKWENAYLTLKNTRASRALRALHPGQYMLASLALRRCAPSANIGTKLLGPPLTKSWIRTWSYYILCKTVHITLGQGMGPDTIGFHTHFSIPTLVPWTSSAQCEWATQRLIQVSLCESECR